MSSTRRVTVSNWRREGGAGQRPPADDSIAAEVPVAFSYNRVSHVVMMATPADLEDFLLDRIGGGDGFATGLIYGLISGREPEEALRMGWAHGALLTTFPGDVTMARLAEVEAFAKGGSARVQR